MEVKDTTTQKVVNSPVEGQGYQEMFSKMKDWGKKSVYDLHKWFSTDDILEFMECGDIYPVNFVEGWKENSKLWNQEEYHRMKEEFFKGFNEGLRVLITRERHRVSHSKRDSGINYWGDFVNPWTPGYDSYKPWIY